MQSSLDHLHISMEVCHQSSNHVNHLEFLYYSIKSGNLQKIQKLDGPNVILKSSGVYATCYKTR